MTNKQAINILLNEQKCIDRNDSVQCDRKCGSCDLVMDVETIREAYNMAISALEKQIPKEAMSDYDPVSKPEHYTNTKVECIDAMIEVFGIEAVKSFCVCNSFKYHWRAKDKNGEEDLQKADWYMQKYKELVNM